MHEHMQYRDPQKCFRWNWVVFLSPPWGIYSWWWRWWWWRWSRLTWRRIFNSHWLESCSDAQLSEARLLGRGNGFNGANRGICRGGGVPENWPPPPLTLPPALGIHMDSDRQEKEEDGGSDMERERERWWEARMSSPGTQMILTVCTLHPLCVDPLKRYQLKTDPGLIQCLCWV